MSWRFGAEGQMLHSFTEGFKQLGLCDGRLRKKSKVR